MFILLLVHEENSIERTKATKAIENILSNSYEYEIPLDTNDIQYGQFDVCTEHSVILLCENNTLKLYDNVNILDEIVWNGRSWGPINFILWCEPKNQFFILSWCRLHSLSIRKIKRGDRSTFVLGDLAIIDQIKSVDWREHPKSRKAGNRLRFITIKGNGFLFLNRGYHTLEQWNIQTWVKIRRWQKSHLGYHDNDRIKLIMCSQNGEHLAMNIWLQQNSFVIDFRRTDTQLTLLKRVPSPKPDLLHKLDLSILSTENDVSNSSEWLIIDGENSFYTIGVNKKPNNLIPIKETEFKIPLSSGFPHLYFQWFYYYHFLIVSTPCDGGRGKLCFFRVQ